MKFEIVINEQIIIIEEERLKEKGNKGVEDMEKENEILNKIMGQEIEKEILEIEMI